MRWDELFSDLEAQFAEQERAADAVEIADRTRRELSVVGLADRIRTARGAGLELDVRGAGRVSGTLTDSGPDWVLLADGGREVVVPLTAVTGLAGLPGRSAAAVPAGSLAARLRLGIVLRGLVRERAPVLVVRVDGSSDSGTLDRVGADYVELAVHDSDDARRARAVRRVVVVPLVALAVVRSQV